MKRFKSEERFPFGTILEYTTTIISILVLISEEGLPIVQRIINQLKKIIGITHKKVKVETASVIRYKGISFKLSREKMPTGEYKVGYKNESHGWMRDDQNASISIITNDIEEGKRRAHELFLSLNTESK